jgi:hypothetical protein
MDWLWIATLIWVALVLPLGVLTGLCLRRLDRAGPSSGDRPRGSHPPGVRSVRPNAGRIFRIPADSRRRLSGRRGRSSPARRATRQRHQVVSRSGRPGRRRGPPPPGGGAGP